MKISMDGRKSLSAKLKNSRRDVKSNLDRERKRSAEHLLSVSIPVTPMSAGENRGELRRSGFVDHALIRDSSLVGFSDPKSIYVHEMGETVYPERAPIDFTTPGTGARFLSGPFTEWKPVYRKNMIRAAKEAIH